MPFENHVILYAKNWYGRSEKGIIADLSVLLAEYANIELQYISKRDVMGFIIHTFINTTTPHNTFEALDEIINPLFSDISCCRPPESILLGKISVWHPDSTFPFTSLDYENLKNGKEVNGMLKTRFGNKEIKVMPSLPSQPSYESPPDEP